MRLGAAIAKDIKSRFDSSDFNEVLDSVGIIYSDSIEEMNRKAKDPDDSERQPLSELYGQLKLDSGLQTKADFFFSGDAYDSFMYETGKRKVSFGYGDSEIASYMEDHERGNKVPKRRQFPIESDSNSSEQQNNIEDVERLVFEMLNKPRTIHADYVVNKKSILQPA